jgi:D-sedoheptulose 7-phosphate isomerase
MQNTSNFSNYLTDALIEAEANLKVSIANEYLHRSFHDAMTVLLNCYKNKGGLYVAGNGGSAADAQHFVAELVVKLNKNRSPIKAVALTVDTSIITAAGNDFSYDHIFSRQVEALMGPNDVFMGITTSGNSPNIIEALKVCKNIGAKSILLTGRDGGVATKENLADVSVIVPGPNTARIQEVHEIVYHTICYAVEVELVKAGLVQYRA